MQCFFIYKTEKLKEIKLNVKMQRKKLLNTTIEKVFSQNY